MANAFASLTTEGMERQADTKVLEFQLQHQSFQ